MTNKNGSFDLKKSFERFEEILLTDLQRYGIRGYVENISLSAGGRNLFVSVPGRKFGRNGVSMTEEKAIEKTKLRDGEYFQRGSTFVPEGMYGPTDVSWYADRDETGRLTGAEKVIAMAVECSIHESLERTVAEEIGYNECGCQEMGNSDHIAERSKKKCEREFEEHEEMYRSHPFWPHDRSRDEEPKISLKLTFMDKYNPFICF